MIGDAEGEENNGGVLEEEDRENIGDVVRMEEGIDPLMGTENGREWIHGSIDCSLWLMH